jgi:23S rRNA (adenine2030-N6)-methyltransferase
MLGYQHAYHAGNMADVIKHMTLSYILDYLVKKDKPLFYLDTHAGRGVYRFDDKESQKTKEYLSGIHQVYQQKDKCHPFLNTYFDVIDALNRSDALEYYPGSPYFAYHYLRKTDRMIFADKHPHEFRKLSDNPLFHHKKIQCLQTDGLSLLKSHLPPIEKRGLIVIDPSYELKEDYYNVPKMLKEAYQRFRQGIYFVWYPILKSEKHHDILKKKLSQLPFESTVTIELTYPIEGVRGMEGCRIWIANPPYTLTEWFKKRVSPFVASSCFTHIKLSIE